jgi:hypothetical protein
VLGQLLNINHQRLWGQFYTMDSPQTSSRKNKSRRKSSQREKEVDNVDNSIAESTVDTVTGTPVNEEEIPKRKSSQRKKEVDDVDNSTAESTVDTLNGTPVNEEEILVAMLLKRIYACPCEPSLQNISNKNHELSEFVTQCKLSMPSDIVQFCRRYSDFLLYKKDSKKCYKIFAKLGPNDTKCVELVSKHKECWPTSCESIWSTRTKLSERDIDMVLQGELVVQDGDTGRGEWPLRKERRKRICETVIETLWINEEVERPVLLERVASEGLQAVAHALNTSSTLLGIFLVGTAHMDHAMEKKAMEVGACMALTIIIITKIVKL